jgi:hypothetical protein
VHSYGHKDSGLEVGARPLENGPQRQLAESSLYRSFWIWLLGQLCLVYNPVGAFLPPPQGELERKYRVSLVKGWDGPV